LPRAGGVNVHHKIEIELMKSLIALTATTALAAALLAGCKQNNSIGSTDAPATNTTMPGASGGSTNQPATNNLPDMHTNMASLNQ
jgi:ABC-type phosphate transport system substrate-binding protein